MFVPLKKVHKLLLFFMAVLPALVSCNSSITGDALHNMPPETHTIVDTISRSGNNRLTSEVTINWWGTDPDGFVAGFEISFDGLQWEFTTRQDTIITFTLPQGQDTADVIFYVRAIDNEGLRDPTPATLGYPIKNSPPQVSFVYGTGSPAQPTRNPVRTFPVLKFTWQGSDPDGPENLSHYELYLNDTTATPYIIDRNFSSATFVAADPSAAVTNALVYLGTRDVPEAAEIPNLCTGTINRLYIRAVDQTGKTSDYVASYDVYVKPVQHKVLLVNNYSSNLGFYENFYAQNLAAAGITGLDTLRVNEVQNSNYTQLAPDNFAQARILEFFDAVIWFGRDASTTLPLAQRTTSRFLDKGGKLFISVNFSSSVEEQASYLDFTPIDSLVSPPSGVIFRIDNNAPIIPVLPGWPTMRSDRIISSARPFWESATATALYNAEITASSSGGNPVWQGKSTVMAKRTHPVNGSKFIISSLELHNLNGNNNMDSLFTKIFADEFGL